MEVWFDLNFEERITRIIVGKKGKRILSKDMFAKAQRVELSEIRKLNSKVSAFRKLEI